MERLEKAHVHDISGKKHAKWEIILTDPGLNKFNFGSKLPDNYIMTDVLSPMGQKSILFNTVPATSGSVLKIRLKMFDVDDAPIRMIYMHSINSFYTEWDVELIDQLHHKKYKISENQTIELEHTIRMNHLSGIGFGRSAEAGEKYPIEIHLRKKEQVKAD